MDSMGVVALLEVVIDIYVFREGDSSLVKDATFVGYLQHP